MDDELVPTQGGNSVYLIFHVGLKFKSAIQQTKGWISEAPPSTRPFSASWESAVENGTVDQEHRSHAGRETMSTIINGIEYANMPVPNDLWRATEYQYAVELIDSGILYLSNAQKYRDDPDLERGDSTETDGRFIRQGVICTTSHTNPIFLWCTTLDSNPESVLSRWQDCDTVVHISNPQALAERILTAAETQGVGSVSFHAGCPTYDKDAGGTAPYHWAESIFQKPDGQALQKEYRFALVGTYDMLGTSQVKLRLGPCNDIVSIIKRRECDQSSQHVSK